MPPFASVSHPPATPAFVQPYYVKIHKNGDQVINASSADPTTLTDKDILGWSYSLSSPHNEHNSNFDITSNKGEWTCPKSGVYQICASAYVATDNNTDNLYKTQLLLVDANGTEIAKRGLNMNTDTADEYKSIIIELNTIVYVAANNKFHLQVNCDLDGQNNADIRIGGDERLTIFAISRIA